MKRLKGIVLEGEKLKANMVTRGNKPCLELYILVNETESVKVAVRQAELMQDVNACPEREPIKVVAEVQSYKDELYFDAMEIV